MSPDRGRPAYRRWQQRVRSRAATRLISMHRDEWLILLREEQTAEPYDRSAT